MNRLARSAALLALVLLLPACASLKPAPPVLPFTFIHASDIHVGAANNADIDAALFKEIAERDPKPAFVVNTGDVCEIGNIEQYQEYRKILKNLGDVRAYVAPGNHDVRWNPAGKEGYVKGTGQPLFQSWYYNGIHFVTLDSTVLLEHWGHISQEQLDWLKKDLAKVDKRTPVILGFHHWLGREAITIDNEQELLELVKPYNVRLWLQGHGHSDIRWNVNGTPAIMVKGLYQGSYAIADVVPGQITLRRRTFPTTKKKAELLQTDKEAAPATRESVITPLMTIDLARPVAPKWSAQAKPQVNKLALNVSRGDLPADAKMQYRVSGEEKYAELTANKSGWTGELAKSELLPGHQSIVFHATLADGRTYDKPVKLLITGPVEPAWERSVGGAVQSRLVRAGDTLYVSTMAGEVVALDPASGKIKWRRKTDGPVFSAVHVDGDALYFGSADHYVYALNAKDGTVRWRTATKGAVLAGPAVAKGVVCVGSADTTIYGLRASDGKQVWTVQGKNLFQSKAATDGERFFVGGWDNSFRCIDAATGHELWAVPLGKTQKYGLFSAFAPAITSPAVGDGKVYVSTNDGILHALDISNGKEAWRIDKQKMGYSSPIFQNGKVYCTLSDDGKVFRVDAPTGHVDWEAETNAVFYDSSCAFGGGKIFIGAVGTASPDHKSHRALLNGILFAIDDKSGKVEWKYRLPTGHLLASPAADDERVYASSMSGIVSAFPITSQQPSSVTLAEPRRP